MCIIITLKYKSQKPKKIKQVPKTEEAYDFLGSLRVDPSYYSHMGRFRVDSGS
jgi:hypothetical protein